MEFVILVPCISLLFILLQQQIPPFVERCIHEIIPINVSRDELFIVNNEGIFIKHINRTCWMKKTPWPIWNIKEIQLTDSWEM